MYLQMYSLRIHALITKLQENFSRESQVNFAFMGNCRKAVFTAVQYLRLVVEGEGLTLGGWVQGRDACVSGGMCAVFTGRLCDGPGEQVGWSAWAAAVQLFDSAALS